MLSLPEGAEAVADLDNAEPVNLPLERLSGEWVTDWEPLIDLLLDEELPVSVRAGRFHASLATNLADQAEAQDRQRKIFRWWKRLAKPMPLFHTWKPFDHPQLGPIELGASDLSIVDDNPFFCPDPERVQELEKFMDALRKEGDSVGARVDVIARGVPPGLGEPVFDKLDADIAHAMMGINAVKGVEIGDGFASVSQKGTEHRDEITPEGFLSNHAGGVLGGISSGQDILVSTAFKPTSSLRLPCRGIDIDGNEVEIVTKGRHDPCVGIRATPIVEAMMAIVLMDHALRHRAQLGGFP